MAHSSKGIAIWIVNEHQRVAPLPEAYQYILDDILGIFARVPDTGYLHQAIETS
jgi:hypothetical protein